MSNFKKLEANIIDVINEEQIKLGYRSEIIHLYYPLSSLNRLLDEDKEINEIYAVLASFNDFTSERLGHIEFSNKNDRFCLTISPSGADYVYNNREKNDFLEKFIAVISKHGCTIKDIYNVFKEYSDNIYIGKMDDDDFDYIIYFKNNLPNNYRYCINFEGHHAIYHRFTPEDYASFGFKASKELSSASLN